MGKPKRLRFCPTRVRQDSDGSLHEMPTILRLQGWRVVVIPGDHTPCHVHVMRSPSEAVLNLNCPDGPIEYRRSVACSATELNWLEKELGGHVCALCDGWRKHHVGNR